MIISPKLDIKYHKYHTRIIHKFVIKKCIHLTRDIILVCRSNTFEMNFEKNQLISLHISHDNVTRSRRTKIFHELFAFYCSYQIIHSAIRKLYVFNNIVAKYYVERRQTITLLRLFVIFIFSMINFTFVVHLDNIFQVTQ